MNTTRIFFLHIPKTAGTSIREYFEWSYMADRICAGFSEISISEQIGREGLSRDLYSGHVSFDYINYFFRDFLWLTFLRDPIARTISQYSNWIDPSSHQERWLEGNGAEAIRAATIKSLSMTCISDFVSADDPIIRGVSFNPLTRNLISGNLNTTEFVPDFYSKSMVDEAFDNLTRRFAYFGITEKMQASLELLGRQYSHLPRRIERKNATPPLTCTADEREVIVSMTRMDIELYQRAVEVFDQRFESSSHWSSSSAALQGAAGIFDKFGEIRADSGLLENGWGFLQMGINGITYRWTEGESTTCSRLLVPSAEGAKQLKILTYGFITREYVDSVEVSLGSIRLTVDSFRTGNYGNIISYELPDIFQAKNSGPLVFDILSPKSIVGQGTSQRSIGFAFFKMEIV